MTVPEIQPEPVLIHLWLAPGMPTALCYVAGGDFVAATNIDNVTCLRCLDHAYAQSRLRADHAKERMAVLRATPAVAVVAKGCRFKISETGETGINSGRPRFRVECETHGLIHPRSTGAAHQVNWHLDDPGRVHHDPGAR